MKSGRRPSKAAGFSLVEVLIAIAAIAVLAGGALMLISGSIKAAKERKLEADVVTINAALATFLANGGDLKDANTAAEIVERIKTRAEADQADQLVGIRGGLLDPRITPVEQESSEAASTDARACWDPGKKRFVLKYNGVVGIKEFVLDESRADEEESEYKRKLVIEYSKKGDDKWVWEYGEHNTAGNPGPNNLAPSGTDPPLPGGFVNPDAVPLDPPIVSIPGDTYPITDYDGLEVTLFNPNPPGVAEMYYSVVPGVWERYLGPIPVEPGTILETQAVTIDPDAWSDSETTLDEYLAEPLQLEIAAMFAAASYDYVSLGGAIEPGSYPDPELAPPGDVTLENAALIPNQFLNIGAFEIRWTLDGSDPLSSPTAFVGEDFSDGFPGQQIPFGMDDWGSGSTLVVKVVAKSLDPNVFIDSEVMEYPLGKLRIQLPPPLVTVNTYDGEVELEVDKSGGQMPLGARIYFTQDGSDPGVAGDGEPVTGSLYAGTPVKPAFSTTVTARTYAPVAYKDWFLPSEFAAGSIVVLGSDQLYIGGEFASGAGMRNIARLAPDGSLDSGFNPGAGADAGSVVGAVSAQGGAGVLAGGNFMTMDGVVRMGLARLRFDGSVDTGFNADLN